MSRVRKSAQDAAHDCFDILHVVDPARSWYSGKALPAQPPVHPGWVCTLTYTRFCRINMSCASVTVSGPGLSIIAGGDDRLQYWWDRLAAVTGRYSRVLMLGDSMGATAALLFSPLATAVHAFTPQVRHTMIAQSLSALRTVICLMRATFMTTTPPLNPLRTEDAHFFRLRHRLLLRPIHTPPATLAFKCPLRDPSPISQSSARVLHIAGGSQECLTAAWQGQCMARKADAENYGKCGCV